MLDLELHLCLGHLVLRADRHIGILGAVLQQHEPAAGLERALQMTERHLRRRQLVVHVHHQHEVQRVSRQARIVLNTKHRNDVRQSLFSHGALKKLQHAGLNVHSVYLAGVTDRSRQTDGEVARTGAEIRHR